MVKSKNSKPESLNTLEVYIFFLAGDTTCLITYLESWLKNDS